MTVRISVKCLYSEYRVKTTLEFATQASVLPLSCGCFPHEREVGRAAV